MQAQTDHASVAAVAGGILLSTLVNLSHHDLIRTAILAAVGTTSSFLVTIFIKWIVGHIKK